MRSKLAFILASAIAIYLIGWASVVFAAPADDLKKMQEQMFGFTAQLNENCSATLIYSDRDEKSGEVETLFLTAKHCVDEAVEKDMVIDIPVYHENRIIKKDRFIARVKGQWFDGDLALVVLKDKQTLFENVAKIAPEDGPLFMGEEVWTVGYPLGLAMTITRGLFGSRETVDYPKDGTEYFRATPAIVGGNSGGGFWHRNAAGDYELIGVTTAVFVGYWHLGLYTPVEAIHEYLKVAVPGLYPEQKTAQSGGN